jgi:hypothetical protein
MTEVIVIPFDKKNTEAAMLTIDYIGSVHAVGCIIGIGDSTVVAVEE